MAISHPEPAADQAVSIDANQFDCAVFDLDGVVTDTAKVHAQAWKAVFDDFLNSRQAAQSPFDISTDYLEYVDGKPRYDGVRDFLASRDIDLPYGDPEDSPDAGTICGLGNRKNRYFLDLLERSGVEVFQSTVALIQSLRERAIRTAIVSASRNCQAVLDAAELGELFDTRVDGADLERMNLPGKPAPDMFLQACRALHCSADRALGFEDAVAGVAAIRAADFACVVGVDRGDQAERLRAKGADIVVSKLGELRISGGEDRRQSDNLPDALQCVENLVPEANRKPAVFLDYDGTLTPIVENPEDALLDNAMRSSIETLSRYCSVAILSGRDLADVRQKVGIENIWYAGSHGFDIAGPDEQHDAMQQGLDYLPALEAAEKSLNKILADIAGARLERKRFSIAVHYRQVDNAADVQTLRQAVNKVHAEQSELRLSSGKKVLELQPDINWHKGKALRMLMEKLGLPVADFMPFYIGDDTTDEDAFAEIRQDGAGILVARNNRATHASYRLEDPEYVAAFLERLANTLALWQE